MKILLNKISENESRFRLFGFIIGFLFFIAFSGYQSFGYRPYFKLKEVTDIVEYARKGTYVISNREGSSSSDCTKVLLGNGQLILNSNAELVNLFEKGKKTTIKYYNHKEASWFVEVESDGVKLLKHNGVLGMITFVIMITTGSLIPFILYAGFRIKKKK